MQSDLSEITDLRVIGIKDGDELVMSEVLDVGPAIDEVSEEFAGKLGTSIALMAVGS